MDFRKEQNLKVTDLGGRFTTFNVILPKNKRKIENPLRTV